MSCSKARFFMRAVTYLAHYVTLDFKAHKMKNVLCPKVTSVMYLAT